MGNLNKKVINLICSIGNMNLSRKAIKSLEIERNFSDVSNKFALTLIDTPQTQLTDLELYMNAGNRNISISYNDKPDESNYDADLSGFVSFTGQIWDYTSNFVGNIKELTISGYVTRKVLYDSSGTALYNIDWNNYFCVRTDTKYWWNINQMVLLSNIEKHRWEEANTESAKKLNSDPSDLSQWSTRQSNVVVYKDFAAIYKENTMCLKIQGPGGSIELPIPDVFAEMVFNQNEEGQTNKYTGDNKDPKDKLWGELDLYLSDPYSNQTGITRYDPLDPESIIKKLKSDWIYKDKSDNIRAFKLLGQKAYIQLNPEKDYYNTGSFLQSDLGVDPSYIVKQLCKLEGWQYTESSIVQTETVPNSDAFKMNNQSALQFISDVLAPVSITPTGIYTTYDGKKVKQKNGATGFHAWFDENNIFHYEPLINLYKKDKRNITMGYNIPNSPVISFQVDTKGTAFYTTNKQEINSIFITTGQKVSSIETTTVQANDESDKTKFHNEELDNFFGYTFEQIESNYSKSDIKNTNELYSKVYGAQLSTVASRDLYNDPYSITDSAISDTKLVVSSKIQDNLVTKISSSGVTDPVSLSAQLSAAADKIKEFMITATLNMWGDTRLYPSTVIHLTNMVKSTDLNSVSIHPTSGDYLILKQVDKITLDTYSQTLSLIRYTANLTESINPQNIDYSKGVQQLSNKTSYDVHQEIKQRFEENAKEDLNLYINLWDEYITAIKRKLGTNNRYWHTPSKLPKLWQDIDYVNWHYVNELSKDFDMTPYGLRRFDVLEKSTNSATGRSSSTSWYVQNGTTFNYSYIPFEPFQDWYKRASYYKKKGILGTKLLHQPKSCLGKIMGIEMDLQKYNSNGPIKTNGNKDLTDYTSSPSTKNQNASNQGYTKTNTTNQTYGQIANGAYNKSKYNN